MTDTREPASQPSEQLRTDDDIVRYVVANAIWAPSVHNTQHWRFSCEGHQISLHADPAQPALVARVSWQERAPTTDYEYELMR